jgi:hypothetical protein
MDCAVSLHESCVERDSMNSEGLFETCATPDNDLSSIGKTHCIFTNFQLVHQNSDTFVVIQLNLKELHCPTVDKE